MNRELSNTRRSPASMAWSKVSFGKHAGKTLPQIVFADPDWFFWAVEQGSFDGQLKTEAEKLNTRACSIRIPTQDGKEFVADYFMHPPTGKLDSMVIVPASRPQDHRKHLILRKKVIDLGMAHVIRPYDKQGCANLITSAKQALLGKLGGLTKTGRLPRMSKKRCEAFFDDPKNFDVDPS
jgi:hypothetical protein